MKRGRAGPPLADGAPSCNVKAVLFMQKRAQAGELLVSRWSELRETALVLIILKGSFGTPVTLVVRAERAIFPLPGGREREFIFFPNENSILVDQARVQLFSLCK